MTRPWEKYINDVLSGKRLAGRLEKLAVERFVRLCDHPDYYFDEREARQVIDIVSCFRHTKGDAYGRRWMWLDWQYFFFAHIFGLKHKKNHTRVIRNVLLLTAKKSGKSEIAGALGVLMTFFDGENSAECYSAANTYDQAKFCWDAGRKIVGQLRHENEWIDGVLEIRTGQNSRSVKNLETESFFNPLAANASTLDGVFPHFSVIDELHAAADNSIKENLESGSIARAQPLLAIVTTRGFNSNGPLKQLENAYIPILENKWQDDSVFALMFCLDDDDDWEDPTVWTKANPGLGTTFSLDALKKLYQTAKTEGATAEVNFKTKNLNIWTNVASVWIQDSIWMQAATDFTYESLKGQTCFAGLDLSSTRDIAAFSMLFPPCDNHSTYRQISRYYCPEEAIKERSRKDRVPYEQWVKDGWLIATPGNVIDYDYIENDIYQAAEDFDLQLINYDRYNGSKVIPQIEESGLECNPFAQTPVYFNAPLKEMERLAIAAMLDQGKDPIMLWMSGNVFIWTDGNGNIKFNKAKARDKIDGMVALGMAFAAYLMKKVEEEQLPDDWAPMVIKRR